MLMGVSRSGPTLPGDDATGSMGLHILGDDGTWNFVAFPERIEAGFEIPSSEIFVMSSAAGPLIIAERGPKGFRVLQRIDGKRSNLIGRTSDAIVASVDGRIQSVSKATDGLGVAVREVDVGRHEIWPGGAIKARDGRIWVASVGSVNADTTWIRERLQGDPPYILTFKAPHNVFQAINEEE
jgi:hypothetical protein